MNDLIQDSHREKLVRAKFNIPREALTVHGYNPNVKLDDLKNKKTGRFDTNKGREVDNRDDSVKKWSQLIDRGEYDDSIYCPPTYSPYVNNTKIPETGFGKLRGHDASGKKDCGAMCISFNGAIDPETKTFQNAEYWNEVACSNENAEDKDRDNYISDPRTNEAIANTLVKMKPLLVDGQGKDTDRYINSGLVTLLIKDTVRQNIIKNLFKKKKNISPDRRVSYPYPTTDITAFKEFRNKVEKTYPQYNNILFKTLDCGTSPKMEIQLEREVIGAHNIGEPFDMVVIRLTRFTSPEHLDKARNKKRLFFTNPDMSFQKDLNLFKSKLKGKIKLPVVKFEPQKETEICNWNNEDETSELI